MKQHNLVQLLLSFLFCSFLHAASTPGETVTIGGQQVELTQLVQTLDGARKQGHRNYKKQANALEKDLANAEAELIQLTQELEAKRISDRVYNIRVEQCNRRIKKAQSSIDNLNQHADDVGKIFTNIVSQGTDILMQTLREDATRKTQIAVAAASAAAGQDVKNRGQLEMAKLLTSSENLTRTGIMIAGTSLGVFGAWHGLKFAYTYAQRYVGMPTLARKTSDKGLWHDCCKIFRTEEKTEDIFKGAIFNKETETVISNLAQSFKACKTANLMMRHALFYGVPGVGKTMIAEKIAAACGFDIVIFSASDLMQFNPEERLKQIRALFERAKLSHRGMLIFVDEAEVFFGNKPVDPVALKEWLSYTGENSPNFTCIYGANDILHPTITSRIDEIIQIKLPGIDELVRMFQYYLDEFFVQKSLILNEQKVTISPEVTQQSIEEIIKKYCNGWSGRDVLKFFIEIPYILINQKKYTVSNDIMTLLAEKKIKQRAEYLTYDGKNAMQNAMQGSVAPLATA